MGVAIKIKLGNYYKLKKDIIVSVPKHKEYYKGELYQIRILRDKTAELVKTDKNENDIKRMNIQISEMDEYFEPSKPKGMSILDMILLPFRVVFILLPLAIVFGSIFGTMWLLKKVGIMSEKTYDRHMRK
jgi:hypothetical protein